MGIGRKDWSYSKVDIYEERNGDVISVDEYLFTGNYSTDYKSYLVNREENMFGFGVTYYQSKDSELNYKNVYVLLVFNGYRIDELLVTEFGDYNASRIRAAYIDGHLYLTSDTDFKVINISNYS